MKRKCEKGFSLTELMIGMLLIGLVIGLGVINTNPGGSNADTKGLALMLGGELRAAKAKAAQTGAPVAVVLPNAGNSRPHSRSIYNLEGAKKDGSWAVITRTVDFSKENAAYLAVAGWPTAATTELAVASDSDPFTLEGWPRTPTTDYIFCFLPSGRVLTNDLPLVDGQYHIAVVAGLDYSAGSAPSGVPTVTEPPAYFNLTAAANPMTVAISPTGAVSVRNGLLGASTVLPTAGPPSTPPAPPVTAASMPNVDPEISGVTVVPPPAEDMAEGFDAILPVQHDSLRSFLQLTVAATDGDGDPLTCRWTSTPYHTSSAGEFSQEQGRMTAVSDQLTWNWFPPADATDGAEFDLVCTVEDALGGQDTLTGSATIKVQMSDNGVIVYQRPTYQGPTAIRLVFGDGPPSRYASPFSNRHATEPRLSPNGRAVICTVDQGDLYTMLPNGQSSEVVIDGPGKEFGADWNRDGTRIVYTEIPPAAPAPDPNADPNDPNTPPPPVVLPEEPLLMTIKMKDKGKLDKVEYLDESGDWLKRKDYDGSQAPVRGIQPSWSPDGNTIVYVDPNGELWTVDSDGQNRTQLTVGSGPKSFPRWAPASDMLLFIENGNVYTYAPATSTLIQRTSSGDVLEADFSPSYDSASGGQIVYSAGSQLRLFQAEMSTGEVSNPRDLGLTGLSRSQGARPDWGP